LDILLDTLLIDCVQNEICTPAKLIQRRMFS
jgi:hypothetical protein